MHTSNNNVQTSPEKFLGDCVRLLLDVNSLEQLSATELRRKLTPPQNVINAHKFQLHGATSPAEIRRATDKLFETLVQLKPMLIVSKATATEEAVLLCVTPRDLLVSDNRGVLELSSLSDRAGLANARVRAERGHLIGPAAEKALGMKSKLIGDVSAFDPCDLSTGNAMTYVGVPVGSSFLNKFWTVTAARSLAFIALTGGFFVLGHNGTKDPLPKHPQSGPEQKGSLEGLILPAVDLPGRPTE